MEFLIVGVACLFAFLVWKGWKTMKQAIEVAEMAKKIPIEDAKLALNESITGLANFDNLKATGMYLSGSKGGRLEVISALYERIMSATDPSFTVKDKSSFRMKLALATKDLSNAGFREQMDAVEPFKVDAPENYSDEELVQNIVISMERIAN